MAGEPQASSDGRRTFALLEEAGDGQQEAGQHICNELVDNHGRRRAEAQHCDFPALPGCRDMPLHSAEVAPGCALQLKATKPQILDAKIFRSKVEKREEERETEVK